MNYIEELIQNRAKEVHYDDFLCHHGIKGQKWGVRRWQNEDGSLTPEGREHYGYGKGRDKNGVEKSGSIVLLAAAPTLLSVAFAVPSIVKKIKYIKNVKGNDKKVAKKINSIDEKRKNEKKDPKTGLYLKNPDDQEPDEKVLNPYYQAVDEGGKNNCQSCSVTYEMRKRGYDVYAKKTEPGFMKDIAKSFKNPVVKSSISRIMEVDDKTVMTHEERDLFKRRMRYGSDAFKTFKDGLLEGGEGSRGNVSIQFREGGGHSMAYEVKNGKAYLVDGQDGSRRTVDEFVRKFDISQYFASMRTDNLELNMDEVKKRVF